MTQSNESDLTSPLMEENNTMMTSTTTTSSSSQDNNGVVTLHGEPVDLSAMFSGATAMGVGGNIKNNMNNINNTNNSNNSEDYNNNINGIPPQEQINDVEGESESPTSTLSLDDRMSNTNPGHSKLDYVKQAIVFLPKKGRSAYYNARFKVSTLLQSRRTKRSTVRANNLTSSSTNSNNNNENQTNRNRITKRSSLFSSSSTPLLLKLLLPPLLIFNHVLFYHAQTAPMWNLSYKTDVTITATASSLKAKAAADALKFPHSYEFIHKEEKLVETFTYMDAIRKLWLGEGLGDAQTISKVAAALLVIASGIWPHLKLLLVHFCWFFPFVHGLWLGNTTTNNNGDDDCVDNADNDDADNGRKCCTRNKGGRPEKKKCGLCCSNGHAHRTTNVRSGVLRTLSTLGKWSLADVLVVCILIAVLHLDWKVDPDEIRAGIENELPTILDYVQGKYPDDIDDCSQLMGYECGHGSLVIHYPACFACKTLIKNAFHHPEWTMGEGKSIMEGVDLEGGGYAQLRVAGMEGTYYFCGAVIMSILLSLVVDMLDERNRGWVEEELLERKTELEYIMQPAEEGEGNGDDDGGLRRNGLEMIEEEARAEVRPPLNEAFSSDDPSSQNQTGNNQHQQDSSYRRLSGLGATSYSRLSGSSAMSIPSPTTNCHLLKQALLILLSISSLPLVCYAVTLQTMQRLVYGGGPVLLHKVLGMIWEKDYSLISLVKTTGDAGGMDTFLMVTFGLFAVVGPIIRSICIILHVLLGLPVAVLADCIEQPRKRTTVRTILYRSTVAIRSTLLPVIDALGAFCCWEVLIVALLMIQLEMPSITDTIYQDDRCEQADPEHGRTCIEVQFNATDNILVVGIAWVVLMVASGLAMDLAVDAEEHKPSLNLGGGEEKRYEFGQPIPQRRSNLNRDRAWMGSSSGRNGQGGANGGDGADGDDGDDGDDTDGDEYFSPLQGGGGQDNGLEEIVFV